MKKKLFALAAGILAVVVLLAGVDLWQVSRFEKPIFAQPVDTADDGGSGRYQGIGYTVDLRGNFLPGAELPGVTSYEYRVFGALVLAAVRD